MIANAETADSSPRLQPLGPPLAQNLKCCISVDQVTALGLRKACRDVCGHFLAPPEHPVFQIELLTNDLESLVENFARVLIGAGLDRQIDHALLFGFQVNRQGGFS